jgi:hypothetical protein
MKKEKGRKRKLRINIKKGTYPSFLCCKKLFKR